MFDIRVVSSPLLAVAVLATLTVLQLGCPHYSSPPASPQRDQNLGQENPAWGAHDTGKRGEDQSNMTEVYGVEARQSAEVNSLKPSDGTSDEAKTIVEGASHEGQGATRLQKTSDGRRTRDFSNSLEWPVKGKVVSGFRVRGGAQFNGILIDATEGSQVKAAAAGTVGHVRFFAGYGNVVLVEHPNGLVTVYGHLKEITVRKGDPVKRGETIAKVARSNGTENSTVYFAVRSHGKPRNPTSFLAP